MTDPSAPRPEGTPKDPNQHRSGTAEPTGKNLPELEEEHFPTEVPLDEDEQPLTEAEEAEAKARAAGKKAQDEEDKGKGPAARKSAEERRAGEDR
jgi:hypothetical protein